MYGRKLPPQYRGELNPYLKAQSFEQICGWIEDAYRLLWTFGRRSYALTWMSIHKTRETSAQSLLKYLRDPQLYAELRFMKERGKGSKRTRNMADRYLKRIASPLLPLMLEILLYLDDIIRELKGNHLDLLIDPFADPHGIGAEEVFYAMSNIEELKRIRLVKRIENADEVAIVQAADLVGFINFRYRLYSYRGQNPDPILDSIWKKYKFWQPDFEKIKRSYQRKHENFIIPAQAIHYLVAKRVVEDTDPEFAEKFMIDSSELVRRVQDVRSDENTTGISILKDPSVCAHLIKPINGEDPG